MARRKTRKKGAQRDTRDRAKGMGADEAETWWDGRFSIQSFDEALPFAQRLVDIDPKAPKWQGYLGVTLYALGEKEAGLDRLRQALGGFQAAIAASSGDEREDAEYDLFRLGNRLFEIDPFEEEWHFQAARLIHDDLGWEHKRAFKVMAVAEVHAGKLEAAVTLLTQCIELDPEYASAHYNLACAFAQLGKKTEMLEALQHAIDHDRDYRDEARDDMDFEPFENDPDFVALTDTLPRDPVLRPLYEHLKAARLARVIELADELESTAEDQLAVWHAVQHALEAILGELAEHPDEVENAGWDATDCEQRLKATTAKIERAHEDGKTSSVFELFRGG